MFWTISIQQRNSTKQARLFELAFAARRGGVSHFRKKNINRVWKSRWSQFVEFLRLGAIVLLFSSQAQSRERVGFLRKGKRFFSFPSLSRFGDVWRGYLRKSSPFTSFSLTFDRLATKFEVLCQFREARVVRCRDSSPLTSLTWVR